MQSELSKKHYPVVALVKESWLPFVWLTWLIFFLICAAIGSSHSPSMTLTLLPKVSLLLLKNKTIFWTRYTFDFNAIKWAVTVRPWDRSQNRDSWKVCIKQRRLKKLRNEAIMARNTALTRYGHARLRKFLWCL